MNRWLIVALGSVAVIVLGAWFFKAFVPATGEPASSTDIASEQQFNPRPCEVPEGFDTKSESYAPAQAGTVYDCSTSPGGRFTSFIAWGYESQKPFVFDKETRKNILGEYYPGVIYSFTDLAWLPNDVGFIIASQFSSIGADGSNGVYLWRASEPARLVTIARAKDTDEYAYSSLELSGNAAELTFKEHVQPFWSGEGAVPEEKDTMHRYNLEEMKLIQ